MDVFTANEAKTQFGTMLLKAQSKPVQINKNGKPAAVMISMETYEYLEELKIKALQESMAKAHKEYEQGNTVDGKAFMEELIANMRK